MNDTTDHDRPRRRRDLLTFDRFDRSGLVVVLAVVALLSVVHWVVAPLLAWAGGESLPLPFSSPVDVPALDAAGIRYSEADYTLFVADAGAGQWLLHLLPGVGFSAVVVTGVLLFAPVVRDLGRGDPFRPENVRRLRLIGLLLLGAWPVITVVQEAVDAAAIAALDLGDIAPTASLTLPLGVMIAGLVVGMVAEAFGSGSRLRADVDGLV